MTNTIPSSAELIARADALRSQLWGDAPEVDRTRRLTDRNFAAMRDARLMQLFTPRRFGGLAADMRTYFEVTAALGRGCSSSAWVAGVLNAGNWMVAQFSEQAQQEVWGTDPLATSCSILQPTGEAEIVDGGIRLNGKWAYSSGSNHCDWAIVTYPSPNAVKPEMMLALLPMSDVEVEDTWFVTGMRGTGSNTIVARDLFVPNHRVLPLMPSFRGENLGAPDAVHRTALAGVLPVSLMGSQIGAAEAALEFVIEKAPKRQITASTYSVQAQSVGFQVDLAEAATTIKAARLIGRQAADTLDEHAAESDLPDETIRSGLRMDMAWAVKRACEGVDRLVTAHGTSAFGEFSPLQRIWRDTGVATRHAAFNIRISQEIYAKALLGLNPYEISFLV
ncbi:acyl-CoA dehydrogenase family protein [Amycolatopsis sp. DSM 110486]|uniref:acyl-CoA dehydrogenase family protein n=1 Tax=Amycolatopsis sp. DSM 110486 TaxID=2865832 RepID=UPI001C6963A0|nr:acyl-CoA dehydrogenase family protein [Amycolatopsis sp. DSM 110486]QYN23225.1 acyl-CoA dehydrogenase family protein [Amycolatopsis sp. DSM 110486]